LFGKGANDQIPQARYRDCGYRLGDDRRKIAGRHESPETPGLLDWVCEKQNGDWRVVAFHDTDFAAAVITVNELAASGLGTIMIYR
jgi:hypothetical protein